MALNTTGSENDFESRDIIKNNFISGSPEAESAVKTFAEATIHPNFMMRNNYFIRKGVPESHRKVADNYMIIKKVFGNPVVQSVLSEPEKELLERYDFRPLQLTTGRQIEEELGFLKKWSYSRNRELQDAADKIIIIRAKELKQLIATNYVNVNKKFDGYKALDNYFEEISKYFKRS